MNTAKGMKTTKIMGKVPTLKAKGLVSGGGKDPKKTLASTTVKNSKVHLMSMGSKPTMKGKTSGRKG